MKIEWSECLTALPKHWLTVRHYGDSVYEYVDQKAYEQQLQTISQWCEDNHCGRRMAYEMWQFQNQQQLTMFLLRWS